MRKRSLALLMALLVGATGINADSTPAPAAGGTSAADAPGAVQAVWIEHRFKFVYAARTAYYSCDGLERKVERIFAAIGVRPGYVVTPRACFSPRHGAEWTPMLDITVASAVEATPAGLDEASKQAQRRSVGAPPSDAGGPGETSAATFPAVVRRIELRDSPTGPLQPGDCELVEQLRDQVLEPLGAKIVADHMSCTYHRLDNNIINLTFDMLVPAAHAAPDG